MLKLHDIAFRISRIDDAKNSNAFHLSGGNSSKCRAARRQNRGQASVHIVDQKS